MMNCQHLANLACFEQFLHSALHTNAPKVGHATNVVAKSNMEDNMKRYVIEREVPGIGSLNAEQLQGAAAKSCDALNKIGTDVQWIESYVAADKTFCVYLAANENAIHTHAKLSGFPANKITEVRTIIDPTTAAA